jgi:hypothetical protein
MANDGLDGWGAGACNCGGCLALPLSIGLTGDVVFRGRFFSSDDCQEVARLCPKMENHCGFPGGEVITIELIESSVGV